MPPLRYRSQINISLIEASITGVSILTAFLGIFDGLQIPIPDMKDLPVKKSDGDWVLVFGGASSVGKSAVQTLKGIGIQGCNNVFRAEL